jgi:VWFA-related protein
MLLGRTILFTLGWVVLAASGLRGQVSIEPRETAVDAAVTRPGATLRVDTNVVLVPVTVCDSSDRPVTGLEKENFRVFDDQVEQTVTMFSMEDAPIAVGLVFDISGSMGPKLRLSRAAANQFFRTANPEDEYFLVEFNDKPRLAVPLTRDPDDIQAQLAATQSKGRTALLDAVVLGIHELKKSGKPRKALLIISDGGDNSSRYTESEVKDLVRETDALIYAIGIYGGGVSPEEASGPGLLADIAEQTGGRHLAADASDIPDIAAKISVELRNRYVLGYSPTDRRRDGRYHPVQVKIAQPRGMTALRASWRRGYFAPDE